MNDIFQASNDLYKYFVLQRDLKENILMLLAMHTGIEKGEDESMYNYLARLNFAGFRRDELDQLIDADFIAQHLFSNERDN